MMHGALLVLAQPAFVEQRIETLFCSQSRRCGRDNRLRTWRGQAGYG